MIKTNKNIKKLKLIYEQAQKAQTIELKSSRNVNSAKEENLQNLSSEEYLAGEYLKKDLLKTLVFLFFAALIILMSYISLNDNSFTRSIIERIPVLEKIKIV